MQRRESRGAVLFLFYQGVSFCKDYLFSAPAQVPQKRSYPAHKLISCKVLRGGHEQRCKTENSAVGRKNFA